MFFNKEKTKLDPKVRFQNRQFNQKLHQARNFKRHARSIPDNAVDSVLARIGLGNRWLQIGILFIAAAVIYAIYIPNPLTVRNIVVEGMPSGGDKTIVEAAINQSIDNAAVFNPQHNILFLSPARVSKAARGVKSVYTVESVTKDIKRKTVTIAVTPKRERFLVATPERVYDVYNDGSLKGQAGIDVSGWANEVNHGMIKVKLLRSVQNEYDSQFFSTATIAQLESLVEELKQIPNSPLVYISFEDDPALQSNNAALGTLTLPLHYDELFIHLQKGTQASQTFMVILDPQSNIHETVKRLQLLLSQTSPDRYNNLYYIDMRLNSRGFICLLGTPCVR